MHKVIIITGTRKGIGQELANYYLSKNFIVAGCSRGMSSIMHGNYCHFELDVSDEKAVIAMIRSVKSKFDKVDILINNAGIASMNHIMLTPISSVQSVFNTNFLGSFIFLRETSKIMIRQKYGRIINFTTVASPLKLEGEAIYAASKAAIERITQIAAKELAEFGITVNAIGPTPVLTDLVRVVPKNKIEDIIKHQAIKRFGTMDDIKNVSDFLIDEKSGFITGQIIYLGGINM